MLKLILSILFLLSSSQSFATDWSQNISEKTLENGLRIVVIENPNSKAVMQMMWYKAGGIDDPSGQSGLAHFLEHLMFKGGDTLKAGEYSRRVREMGGQENAFTSHDYTAYFASVPRRHLNELMELEASRLLNFNPPSDEAKNELLVVHEERRNRTDANPSARLYEAARNALFPNNQYGRPVIGWEDELQAMTLDSAKFFHKKNYDISRAILIVSGDVDKDRVFKKASDLYSNVQSNESERETPYAIPDFHGISTNIELRDKNVRQPLLLKMWRVPSWSSDKDAFYSLEVAVNILGSGSSSHLYQDIVVKKKLATSISLSYDGDTLGDGVITLSATPSKETDIDNLLFEINKSIDEFSTQKDDILAAKKDLISSYIYAQDSLKGKAYIAGLFLTTGRSIQDIGLWSEKINEVTQDDISMVVERFIKNPKSHFVTARLIPYDD